MSGSDSSVRSRSRASDGGTSGDCPAGFRTILASPNPEAIDELELGEILDLVRIDQPVRGVLAKRLDGVTVGAVIRELVRLRECIARGVLYEAEVVSITGGAVTVDVRQS
jgi:hypothetical protein